MRRLLIAVGVNLLLGVPGAIPIAMVWYFLAYGPLSDLGRAAPKPDEAFGTLALGLLVLPIVLASGVIWALVNRGLWRRTEVPAWSYWMACVVAFFLPFLVLAVYCPACSRGY